MLCTLIFIFLSISSICSSGNYPSTSANVLQDSVSNSDNSILKWNQSNFESYRRIWCFSPRDTSNKDFRRYGLPSRFLVGLRKDKDIIILPGHHKPTEEYVKFLISVLDIKEDQIIWTSGNSYRMDEDVNEDQLHKIKELIELSDDKWLIIPYGPSPAFRKWTSIFSNNKKVSLFSESVEWIEKFGNKGMLHRKISDLSLPSVIEEIDSSIPIPRGFYCENSEELKYAYELLNTTNVVIKPISGSSGEGIEFVSSLREISEYSFPMGNVVLEEHLPLDRSNDDVVISPAVHYIGPNLLGKELVDQIMEKTTWLGWRESVVSAAFAREVFEITEKLINYTMPQGPGGFDFLSVGGKPVLVDINTGRFNGAHQPKVFLSQYCPELRWYCWKYTPSTDHTVQHLWEALLREDLAYVPGVSTEGVFPLSHIRGVLGLYIAVANTTERAHTLYLRANKILRSFDSDMVTEVADNAALEQQSIAAEQILNMTSSRHRQGQTLLSSSLSSSTSADNCLSGGLCQLPGSSDRLKLSVGISFGVQGLSRPLQAQQRVPTSPVGADDGGEDVGQEVDTEEEGGDRNSSRGDNSLKLFSFLGRRRYQSK